VCKCKNLQELVTGHSGIQCLAGGKRFFLSPERPDLLLGPPSLLVSGHLGWFFPPRDKFQGANLTTNLHPALRMLGTIYLLPLYVFVAWTAADLPSSLYLPVASCGLIIISKMQTFSIFQICGKLQSSVVSASLAIWSTGFLFLSLL